MVSKVYSLNIQWIMEGNGPIRLDDVTNAKTKVSTSPVGPVEEWLIEIREKEGDTGRIALELRDEFPEFKDWWLKKRKKLSSEDHTVSGSSVA